MSRRASRCSTRPPRTQLLEQLSLDVMLKAADDAGQPARPRARPGRARRRRRDVPRHGARGDPRARQADALGRRRRRRAAGDGAAFAGARHRAGRNGAAGRGRDLRRQPDRRFGMGRGRRGADRRLEDRQGPGRALPRAGRAERHRTARHLSRHFLHQQARQGRESGSSPTRSRRTIPTCASGCTTSRPRLGAAAAQARDRGARPQRRAVHHRPCRDRALPRREGPARPARLRRPDRQDARAAQQRLGRLGALQARPRHRPCADRRGAGHEPEAMGDREGAGRRILRRRRARTTGARTIFAVGDEKQSIFSFQGAAPREFDGDARAFRATCTSGRSSTSSRPSSSTRSAPARTCWAPSTRCSCRPTPTPA